MQIDTLLSLMIISRHSVSWKNIKILISKKWIQREKTGIRFLFDVSNMLWEKTLRFFVCFLDEKVSVAVENEIVV